VYTKMATEDTELPTPQTEGEGDDTVIPVHPVVLEDVRAPMELNEDRYRLKAPTFTSEEEVEQSIKEFYDVMEVTQWPPRAALLKLRMSLMDKAKPYGLGPDINSIFASLLARFGISASDTRAWLQRLRRDPHTSLPEHAATVRKLAQIVYSDLPQANRERYTYNAFVQSVNDLGLHHQFLVRGVTTVEGALAEGEAYLLASHMQRNHETSHQVDMKPSVAPADPGTGLLVPAKVTQLTAASNVAQLTDMLAKLVSALAPQIQVDTAPQATVTRHGAQLLLGMRETWTFPEILPSAPPRVKLPRTADVPAHCEPTINSTRERRRRPPRRASRTDTPEWQHPRRVSCSSHSPPVFSMPLRNRLRACKGIDHVKLSQSAKCTSSIFHHCN